jgi:hypothetical protein
LPSKSVRALFSSSAQPGAAWSREKYYTENERKGRSNFDIPAKFFSRSNSMACNHLGPIDIMPLAEARLRELGVVERDWNGELFGFGENVTGSQWVSVYTEIERRGESWVVTRIDRRPTLLSAEEEGLVRIGKPKGTE